MKRMAFVLSILAFIGCSGMMRSAAGTFEHVVIPQPEIANPTFSVYVEGVYSKASNEWLKSQIETSLMQEKVSVLTFSNNKEIITTTTGEGQKATAQDTEGATLEEGKVDVQTKTGLKSIIKADYLFHANYDNWTFSVIAVRNEEIVAKGTFTSMYVEDIRKNVGTILKEMKIIQ